jgi:hypothetical protein
MRIKINSEGKALFTRIIVDGRTFTPESIKPADMEALSKRSAHLASFFEEEPKKAPKSTKDDQSESKD